MARPGAFKPGADPRRGRRGGRKKTPEDVKAALEAATPAAVDTLIDLMHGAESEAVRRAAADSILDRHLGKPVQAVVADVTSTNTNVAAPAPTAKPQIAKLNPALAAALGIEIDDQGKGRIK